MCYYVLNIYPGRRVLDPKWVNKHAGYNAQYGANDVMHICVGNLTIIGSANDLSPDRRQAIISTNAGMLFIGPYGINFSEILTEIHTLSFKEMHLKISSGKWQPFCLDLNRLKSDLIRH